MHRFEALSVSRNLKSSRLRTNKQICQRGELSKGFTLQPVNIAIIGYRDVCVCSHEELVTGLASSDVHLTGIFLKNTTNLQG